MTDIILSDVAVKCRLRVSEEFFRGGDALALRALACSAIILESEIDAGNALPAAIDELADCAKNLGLTERLGGDVIDTCVGVGAVLYREIADVLGRRSFARAA